MRGNSLATVRVHSRQRSTHQGDGADGALLKHEIFAETAYKTVAKSLHPDKGGSDEEFAKLEKAMSLVREHFKALAD
jgi:hypothetical protein